MALNYVTLTGQVPGGAGASVVFTPSGWETDSTDKLLEPPAPKTVVLDGLGKFSVLLLATDNAALPSGWTWGVVISGISNVPTLSFSFFLPFSGGATQDISSLATVVPTAGMAAYLQAANNLSELTSPSVARNNLGLGSAALLAATALLQAANNLSEVANPATALKNLGGLGLQAATPAAGFALSPSGTPSIVSWTCPNDGNNHRFVLIGEQHVSSAETGGQVTTTFTAPDGTVTTTTLFAGGGGLGVNAIGWSGRVMQAGSTVTIAQGSALTVGACTLWCEIWGL